ncbi:unnamed protein product [Medioppia subpectinata]|uniref:Protein kinase domain-containing protein n=1 Tax=Medioppia subpectinata TaxID=1979941 RepID=A0A7R9KF22_9ACAR|nr:unnamed protein product [Medioppia subpectinata]CAG2102155.1 unnamed protein product [Medioppia subpectinata]
MTDLKLNARELQSLTTRGLTLETRSISCGSYANVYKAKTANGESRAVKIIDCTKVSNDYRERFLPRELYALKKLNHRFIATVFETFLVSNRMFMVMELATGGDLLDILKENEGPLENSKSRVMFRQIAEALKYMHSEGIVHRDLKCENVLIFDNKKVAKITDFGFARTVYLHTTGRRLLTETACGTIGYVSPELLGGHPFDAMASDCWSLGVILYVMSTTKLPFNTRHQRRRQLTKRYKLPERLHNDCKDIIKKLLEPTVSDRPKMDQVLQHKWISQVIV